MQALIGRQFKGVDDQPVLRRKSEAELMGAAEAGAEKGGLVLYLSFMDAAGMPLSASLLVSYLDQKVDGLQAVAGLAGDGDVTAVRLPAAGLAARRLRQERTKQSKRMGSEFSDTLVEYFVPVPKSEATLLLTFSTPLEFLAEPMAELFDAVAGTLRWSLPQRDQESE